MTNAVTLRRQAYLEPGYDCVRHPCGKGACGKTEGGNHGIHCDAWRYVFTDGQIALSLLVYSGNYPESVPSEIRSRIRERKERAAEGVDIQIHTAFPLDRESLKWEPAHRPCEYLDGGADCYGAEGSILEADAFFKMHGTDSFDQPESFWSAFEAEWLRRAAKAFADRVDTKWKRCACCNGAGTVAIEETYDRSVPEPTR